MTPDHLASSRDPARSAEEFVRLVRARDEEVTVLVYTTKWLTPYTPRSQWVVAGRRSSLDSEAEARMLVEEVLRDPAFFGTCEECGDHNPRGWMHSAILCQGCALTGHGVVY